MAAPHTGELAALATACCWTVSALAFEASGRRVGSLAVNLVRLGMAFALLALFCAITRGLPLPTDATPRQWALLSLSGLVGFLVGDLCLFRALVVLGARLSMLVMALVPVLTALLGLAVLGEGLPLLAVVGMGLTVSGVAWVALERRDAADGEASRPVRGILLALGAAAGQAGGLVLSKAGMGDLDPFAATQIRVLAGIAGFSALFFVLGWWPRVRAALADRRAVGLMSLGAVFGPFLGVSLSLYAVRHAMTGVAATIMATVPILIIPPSVLLFRDRVSARAAAGAVLAVAGVALLFL